MQFLKAVKNLVLKIQICNSECWRQDSLNSKITLQDLLLQMICKQSQQDLWLLLLLFLGSQEGLSH